MDPRNPQMPVSPEPAPQPQSGEPLVPAVPELPQSQPAATPAPAAPPTEPALPAAPPAAVPTPPTPSPASASPSAADDVDVIEKEWVDAADQVVKANKEDPHREEEAFEALQVDYLKKRYGKDIKQPTDE